MTATFYVYTHRRADTGAIFYVGKGRKRRAWNRSSRNQFWQRVAAKTEVIVEIVKDGLSELCAFTIEKIMIACLKAKGFVLANLSSGGEGNSGRIVSEKTREIIRSQKTGKKLSPEHARKISDALKGVPTSEAFREKCRNREIKQETRDKLRIVATGRVMSAEAVEKMRAKKIGKPNSEVWHAKMKGKLAGSKNPHHCPILYTFKHDEHGVRVCTQYDLRSEYGLSHGNLSKMVSGLRNMVGGWSLVKE